MGRLRPLIVNWPRLVIDSLEERLDVEGFRLGAGQPANDRLWAIWQGNDLDEWSQQCHIEALLHGRAYVLVWADELDAGSRGSASSRRRRCRAVRAGHDDDHARGQAVGENDLAYATVYLPDLIYRYVAPRRRSTTAT
jgi:hypothetical protein